LFGIQIADEAGTGRGVVVPAGRGHGCPDVRDECGLESIARLPNWNDTYPPGLGP